MRAVLDYIDWHYFRAWPIVVTLWRNLTLFFLYYFQLPQHTLHLFSPWKRMAMEKKRRGFHLDDILSALSFNLISRCIGFVLRSWLILTGTLCAVAGCFAGLLLVVLWIPALGVSLPWYFSRRIPSTTRAAALLAQSRGNLPALAQLLWESHMGVWVAWRLGVDHQSLVRVLREGPAHTGRISPTKTVTMAELFGVVASRYAAVTDFLTKYRISADDVEGACAWYERIAMRKEKPLIMELSRIQRIQGIGSDWNYGYTPTLDRYAHDIATEPSPYPLLVGREEELETMERILCKTHGNNALIVGEPGVARHALLATLGHRLAIGACPRALIHKRILSLAMHSILADYKNEALKGFLETLFAEAENAGDVILAIDDIDRYLTAADDRIDISDVFEAIVARPVPCIGITTPAAYHRYITPNRSIMALFETVSIDPPTHTTLLAMLEESITPRLEARYPLTITYPALTSVETAAMRYFSTMPFPASAITLLDEACLFATSAGYHILLPEYIDTFLSQKFHANIGKLKEQEKHMLSHLEDLLHERIINQRPAIGAIANSLRRSRLNLSSDTRPVGSFLFLGPTGVGKTETAKALADVYFGGKTFLHRFDMSQYKGNEGMQRLIGAASTGNPGELTRALTQQPFGVLLFDEFEKADTEIYNLLLTLLDEGYITDAGGNTIDARQTLIIATSNAGGKLIRESIHKGFTHDMLKDSLVAFLQDENIFSAELLNRFDAVIVFTPLSEGHMREVARHILSQLNLKLSKQKLSVAITPELLRKLVPLGFDAEFGARAIRRVIEEKVEDTIAKKMLDGEVKPGDTISIDI